MEAENMNGDMNWLSLPSLIGEDARVDLFAIMRLFEEACSSVMPFIFGVLGTSYALFCGSFYTCSVAFLISVIRKI